MTRLEKISLNMNCSRFSRLSSSYAIRL
ncbi:hypothetical protein [Acinetobacter baumannii]